jgi:TldD protein
MPQDRPDPLSVLDQALAGREAGFVELRYQSKRARAVAVEKGRLDTAQSSEHTGVGVRVMELGTFGFASTPELEANAIRRAIDRARAAARASAAARETRLACLPTAPLVRGRFEGAGVAEAEGRDLGQVIDLALRLEARARSSSARIESASCRYAELLEEKAILTSDGARVHSQSVRPEFRIGAVAREAGELQRASRAVGVSGGWDCLFRRASPEQLAEEAARLAVERLSAGYPEGGRATVLLAPSLVGLLTHEAIGHTVEADFVTAGSVAAGKLGQRVASELITLCDSGHSEFAPGAGGSLAVDDEGVATERTVVIERGVLKNYLHNRESAARFGVRPTGNARAWEYQDEPLIRMRNTYIEPGRQSLEELIDGIEDGYLLDGAANGQADANGEFMFGTQQAYRIQRGKRGPLLRGVNLSGRAFEVLSSVDGVGSEFLWDLGSGHCGKGQPMKVDAGGPWIRCQVLLGGRQ